MAALAPRPRNPLKNPLFFPNFLPIVATMTKDRIIAGTTGGTAAPELPVPGLDGLLLLSRF